MIVLRLGRVRPVQELTNPFLPRSWIGYSDLMPPQILYDAARGWWRLSERATRERFSLVVSPEDVVVMGIEIEEGSWRYDPEADRRAFAGRILAEGDEVHDRFVGKKDPTWKGPRQNPVRFYHVPGLPDQYLPCDCGCGQEARGRYLTGHDRRALYAVLRDDFGGDIAQFLRWYSVARHAFPTPKGLDMCARDPDSTLADSNETERRSR